MRRTVCFFMALALAVSCSKGDFIGESGDEASDTREFTFNASFDAEVQVRTSISDDGKVSWNAGDVIRYYSRDYGTVRTYTIPEDCSRATFTATLDGSSKYLVACYGGSSLTSVKSGGFSVSGAAGKNQSGKFGDAHLCVAVSDLSSETLFFYNVLGAVKFSISDGDVAFVEFTSNGGETLSSGGRYNVSIKDGVPSAVASGVKNPTVVVNTNGTGPYYMGTAPVKLESGFEIKLFDADSCYIGRVCTDKVLNIERNVVIDLGEFDSRIEYAPRIGLIHYGGVSDIHKDGAVWKNCVNASRGRLVYFKEYATTKSKAASMVSKVDAVIDPGLHSADHESRASYDNNVLNEANALKMPVLGICYGHQRMNTFCGGKNMDVTTSSIKHKVVISGYNYGLNVDSYFHQITIDKTSLLYRLLGQENIMVNTSHNYAVNKIAPGFKVVATSPDGVNEALEGENFLGVQFHPEVLYGRLGLKTFLPIFTNLVERADAYRKSKK